MTNNSFETKLLLLFSCLLVGGGLYAQGWKWVNPVASSGTESAYDVAVDPQRDRVTVVGTWDGTDLSAELGGDFSPVGNPQQGLVAQYKLSGELVWAFSLTGTGNEEVLSVDCDEIGNIYIAGYFSNNLNMQGNGGRSEILLNSANDNSFLAKYDTSGHLLWAVNMNSPTGNSQGLGVVTDTQGVFFTGFYQGTSNFVSASTAPNFVVLPGRGASVAGAMYLAAFDTSGSLVWLADGGNAGQVFGRSVDANPYYVYLSGDFSGANFSLWDGGSSGSPTVTLPNTGGDDAFFLAFRRSDGQLKWSQKINCGDNDFGYAISVTDRVLVGGPGRRNF